MGGFLSFFSGAKEAIQTSTGKDSLANSSAPEAASSPPRDIPGYCTLTAQYAYKTQGSTFTRQICENEMEKDVAHILSSPEKYLKEVGREDLDSHAWVVDDYDNSSKVCKIPGIDKCNKYTDDIYWSQELTKRVTERAKSQNIDVSADMKNRINRLSKLNRRGFHDSNGGTSSVDFGEVVNVYRFSGLA